jgi:hypothetical protein
VESFLRRARLVVDGGLALLAIGLGGLLLLAWVEYLRIPGSSLVDGYWVGREPWTSLGLWAVLVGASVTLGVGVLVALLDGSWIRKLLALLTLVLPAYWWLAAVSVLPGPGVGGSTGRLPVQGWTPTSLAYSAPETTVLALLLPAVVAGALALAPRRLRPSSRMTPVHTDDVRRPS